MEPALGRCRPTRSSSKSYTDTHRDSLRYDIITHTLGPIQDRIHIQPVRKLSVWKAVLKERYCRTPGNHIRCICRDQNCTDLRRRKAPAFSVSETPVGPTIQNADCQEECVHFFFFFFNPKCYFCFKFSGYLICWPCGFQGSVLLTL